VKTEHTQPAPLYSGTCAPWSIQKIEAGLTSIEALWSDEKHPQLVTVRIEPQVIRPLDLALVIEKLQEIHNDMNLQKRTKTRAETRERGV
jgi:hypothetical protein